VLFRSLIKPIDYWSARYQWSPKSQRVHCIPRALLVSRGVPPKLVAQTIRAIVDDGKLVTDNVEFDHRWLSMLNGTANIPTIKPAEVDELVRSDFLDDEIKAARRATAEDWESNHRRMHRAAADVLRHLCILRRLLKLSLPSELLAEHGVRIGRDFTVCRPKSSAVQPRAAN
jgi:hypothetical protein